MTILEGWLKIVNHMDRYELASLIDLDNSQRLLDSFCDAVGIAAAIIDLEGRVLVGSRWQRICTHFHRVNEETFKRCIESDTQLANALEQGKRFSVYECRNGLTDAASPILIEGDHIANVFVGQFLLKEPDTDLFRRQAAAYGFDEADYLNALCEVPIIEEEKLSAVLGFLTSFAETVAKMGFDRVKQMEAKEAIRESEEKYRILVENAGEAIFVAREGMLTFANSKTEKIIGYARDHLTTRPFTDFIHADDRAQVLENHRKRLQGMDVPSIYTFRIVHESGEVRWVELNVVRIEWEGRPATLNFLADITGRKRAEEAREKLQGQFLQAQKMESVGRLAGGVAHDFNNKLGIIIGNAEMAMLKVNSGESLLPELDEILRAAHGSADLVRQLLAFARKQTVSPKVLDLNDSVAGMLKMLRRLIGEDIDLVWVPGLDLWPVKIDPSQIDQILANLAVNARDAIAGVGKVTIETVNATFDEAYCGADHPGPVPGQYVLLTVSDDGKGMNKEVLEHLFEPFFTTKEVGKGTGLGLATIYGIVKQNNGFISVHSEPGEGTTFKIYLPRFETLVIEAEAVGKGPEALQGGTETVLMVEDESAILKIGKAMLESLGYTVLTADTPEEAVRLAGAHPGDIHLLFTDMVMPGMNGRELAEQIKAIRPGIGSLYMSGYTANVIAHHGVLDEGVLFIHKPFSMTELAPKIRRALVKA
ncbi:MAG: PocR ligand-binding domain-containing protein [Deltaproteobacteria bacterium]|nr:PocR ligand-binding domain-containing protein [Deltaproteobacteria bacterium]